MNLFWSSVILVLISVVLPFGVIAQGGADPGAGNFYDGSPAGCVLPSDCPDGQKAWIDTGCQQNKLLGTQYSSACCKYYCAAAPTEASSSSSEAVKRVLQLDTFESSIDFSTPEGIAALISVALQIFFALVAIISVFLAVRAAIALANSDNPESLEQSKKTMTTAVVGLIICGLALLIVQIVINFLGLSSIDQVFEAVAPVISGGDG